MPKTAPRPRAATPVLIIGAVLVLALIGVSLSRTLRPSTQPSTSVDAPAAQPVVASTQPLSAEPAPNTASLPQSTTVAPPNALPPLASPRGAIAAPVITPPVEEPEPHGAVLASVPRIPPEDLLEKLKEKSVTVIDVRDADSYLARHIPGSLHIPLARIDGEVPYLPRDKPIVAYCT